MVILGKDILTSNLCVVLLCRRKIIEMVLEKSQNKLLLFSWEMSLAFFHHSLLVKFPYLEASHSQAHVLSD